MQYLSVHRVTMSCCTGGTLDLLTSHHCMSDQGFQEEVHLCGMCKKTSFTCRFILKRHDLAWKSVLKYVGGPNWSASSTSTCKRKLQWKLWNCTQAKSEFRGLGMHKSCTFSLAISSLACIMSRVALSSSAAKESRSWDSCSLVVSKFCSNIMTMVLSKT